MTGLHPGDHMLHDRPVPPAAVRPLRRRCAAGILTALLLTALVLVFLEGTVIRAIQMVQPAVLVRLAENKPKPPPLMKFPVPLVKPQVTQLAPPQVIIAPDPIVPTPPAPAAMVSAPVASPVPVDPGVDLIAIARAYVIKVHDRVNGRVILPPFAIQMGEEGIAVVHIVMTSNGTVLSESLAKSSGHSDLDKEALATVLRAQPLPPIPAILHLEKLETNIPIAFQIPSNASSAFGFRR